MKVSRKHYEELEDKVDELLGKLTFDLHLVLMTFLEKTLSEEKSKKRR